MSMFFLEFVLFFQVVVLVLLMSWIYFLVDNGWGLESQNFCYVCSWFGLWRLVVVFVMKVDFVGLYEFFFWENYQELMVIIVEKNIFNKLSIIIIINIVVWM